MPSLEPIIAGSGSAIWGGDKTLRNGARVDEPAGEVWWTDKRSGGFCAWHRTYMFVAERLTLRLEGAACEWAEFVGCATAAPVAAHAI